jgi:hypothetical protein
MFLWKSKAAAPPLHAHDAPSKPRSPLPGPGGCGGVNPPGAMPTRNGSPVALYKPPAPTSIRRRRVPELGISLSLTEATRQTSPRGWGPRGHRRHKRHGLGEIPARISAPQCAWDYGPNRTALLDGSPSRATVCTAGGLRKFQCAQNSGRWGYCFIEPPKPKQQLVS